MKNDYSLLTLIFLLLTFSLDISANEVYQWISADGKKYFSDTPSKSHLTALTPIKKLATIKMVKVKPIEQKRSKKVKKSRKRNKPISQCQQTKRKIAKLEKKLSLKNKAASFDYLNKQLSELRWVKLNKC